MSWLWQVESVVGRCFIAPIFIGRGAPLPKGTPQLPAATRFPDRARQDAWPPLISAADNFFLTPAKEGSKPHDRNTTIRSWISPGRA
jgi:hypothetical protein